MTKNNRISKIILCALVISALGLISYDASARGGSRARSARSGSSRTAGGNRSVHNARTASNNRSSANHAASVTLADCQALDSYHKWTAATVCENLGDSGVKSACLGCRNIGFTFGSSSGTTTASGSEAVKSNCMAQARICADSVCAAESDKCYDKQSSWFMSQFQGSMAPGCRSGAGATECSAYIGEMAISTFDYYQNLKKTNPTMTEACKEAYARYYLANQCSAAMGNINARSFMGTGRRSAFEDICGKGKTVTLPDGETYSYGSNDIADVFVGAGLEGGSAEAASGLGKISAGIQNVLGSLNNAAGGKLNIDAGAAMTITSSYVGGTLGQYQLACGKEVTNNQGTAYEVNAHTKSIAGQAGATAINTLITNSLNNKNAVKNGNVVGPGCTAAAPYKNAYASKTEVKTGFIFKKTKEGVIVDDTKAIPGLGICATECPTVVPESLTETVSSVGVTQEGYCAYVLKD